MNDTSNDKPFVCTERGCLMKFSNIDHLTVHQKKHEMRLKFSGLSSGGFAIADQTPTPSRILGSFLQNWEEVGLNTEIQEITNLTPILNDINHSNHSKTADNSNTCNSKSSSDHIHNPFANSFKNALKAPELTTRIMTTSSDSPLNTPSIFPNEGLMAIVNAALNTPDPDFDKIVDSNNIAVTLADGIANTSGPTKSSNLMPRIATKGQKFQAVPVIRTNTNLNNNILICPSIPNIIISQPNHKVLKTINTTKLKPLPIAQTPKTTAIIAPKAKESSISVANTNNSLYKVILKLPDGRSVQLPLIQSPISQTSIQPTITAITTNSKDNNFNEIQLTDKITIGTTTPSSSQPNQTSSLSSLQSKVDATLASLPPKAKPGRKSKFAPEEDPKEKKARSLERNRAAAMRCRLKRKHWIDSLEEKADEYEKINEKLQSEVVALRREVTLLKTALLAHKDCPVTLQQQKVTNVSTEFIAIATTNGNIHKLDNNIETNGLT